MYCVVFSIKYSITVLVLLLLSHDPSQESIPVDVKEEDHGLTSSASLESHACSALSALEPVHDKCVMSSTTEAEVQMLLIVSGLKQVVV